MRPREKATPLLLLGCGCAAVAALALLRRGEEVAEPSAAGLPPVAGDIMLGLAALGTLAWVPAGILLMWKGLQPPKGAQARAGLFEVVGAIGVYLIVLVAVEASLGSGLSLTVHLSVVAAAHCAAIGYAWLRLRAFPAPFEKPLWNSLSGAAVYLLMSPFLVAVAFLNGLAMRALGIEPEAHPALQKLFSTSSGAEMAAILILGVLVAPLVEEVVFRGIVYGALRKRLAPVAAACLSGAIFAAVHAQPTKLLPLFVLGLALALVYEQTGSLATSVGLHAANNAVTFAALLVARLCASGGG